MIKADSDAIVSILKVVASTTGLTGKQAAWNVAYSLANHLKSTNKSFDVPKFMKSCGLTMVPGK